MLTLENGVVVKSSEAFTTRQEACETLSAEIKAKLVNQQVRLENLKHKMAYEEAVLKRIEKEIL